MTHLEQIEQKLKDIFNNKTDGFFVDINKQYQNARGFRMGWNMH